MIWGIGTLFLTSCPNETNTLKLESSDGFLHLRETSLDTKWEVEHFRLFFVFLIAGLVDLGSESLNFSNAPNTDKQMHIYPKIASRLGQHLLRAKPGNLEDWKLIKAYLLFIPSIFSSAIWLLSRKQSHSPNVHHCILAINFWPNSDWKALGLYT